MAVVSQLHTVTNQSATARKVGGVLVRAGEKVRVPLDKFTKADRQAVTDGDFLVAPALPPSIEDVDQALFEFSTFGELTQVVVGVAKDIAVQMPFKASRLVTALNWAIGGGAVSALSPANVVLKNNEEYDLTEVVFLEDQSANAVLLSFRP